MRLTRTLSIPLSTTVAALFAVSCGEGPTEAMKNAPAPQFAKPDCSVDPSHPSCKDDGGDGGGGGKTTFNLVFSGHITGGKDGVELKVDDPFQQIKERGGVVLQLVDADASGVTCDALDPNAPGWGPYNVGDWTGTLEIAKRGGSLSRFQFVGDQPDGGHVNIVLNGGTITEVPDTPGPGDVTVEYRNVCAKTSNTSDPGSEGDDTLDRRVSFDVVADRN